MQTKNNPEVTEAIIVERLENLKRIKNKMVASLS